MTDFVKINKRLVSRIRVREWGLPTLRTPGKIWRSKKHQTVTCLTVKDDSTLNIETLPMIVVGEGQPQWMPDHWREAMWDYVQKYPNSGCYLGPFLAITKEQRCDFVRTLASRLATADNIGCLSMAFDIGQFASWEYELPEPTDATSPSPS